MNKQHTYNLIIQWTGNTGAGTMNYRAYKRSYTIQAADKATISGSSDPAFLGDKTKYSPEDLLLASLSSCHMLWYLHLCAEAGVVVTGYTDHATGSMEETTNGGGHFTSVCLYPVVTVASNSMVTEANAMHKKATELCFIANSVNFPVSHKPICRISGN
jgi:organic hydroperoxide reductase OsmC/OhrA